MGWIRGPTIGRGATATVSLARAIPSGEVFAVKSTELCKSMLLQRENYFLSKLSCPRIVKYMGYDIVTNEANKQATYNLCMEYVPGGTLFEEIQRLGGRLGEGKVRVYTQQILQGLNYLHVNGVVHCDIKSQNILIGKEGAKIADLGCAKLMQKVGDYQGFDNSSFSGTPVFMAPEVARGEVQQGPAADIWALGCTIIEMSTGNSPWPELNDPVSALYKIGFSGDIPEIPSWLSEEGKDFVGKCLKRDVKDRWTAKELLQHPFLEESDTHSKQVKDSTMSSPCSVLDQGFWDSFDVVGTPKNVILDIISLNSPSDRIKKLLQSSNLSPASNACNWTWSEDWIKVRSNDIEENKESSDDSEDIVEDDFLFTTVSILDSEEEEEEEEIVTERSIPNEDFLLENPVENMINSSSNFAFDCIIDEFFVSEILNFGTSNKIFYSSPIPFFIYDLYSIYMLISPNFPGGEAEIIIGR